MLEAVEHVQPRFLRLVVADDNDEMRRIMVSILARAFTVVDVVGCGRALVDAALAAKPDVVVSDVQMPVMNGIEAMAALRAAGWHPPFVLVTASTSDALELINRGALAVVDKTDLHAELVTRRQVRRGGLFLPVRRSPALDPMIG